MSLVLFLLPLLAAAQTPACTKTDASAGDGIRCLCTKSSSVYKTCLPLQLCNSDNAANADMLCVYPTCPVIDGSALFLGFTDANDATKVTVNRCQCGGIGCSTGQSCNSAEADDAKCQYQACTDALWMGIKDKGGNDFASFCTCDKATKEVCSRGYLCKNKKCVKPVCSPSDGSAANTVDVDKYVGCACGAVMDDGWQPACNGDQLFCDASRANDAGSCRCGVDATGACMAGDSGSGGKPGNTGGNTTSTKQSTNTNAAAGRVVSSAVAAATVLAMSCL